jgi:hypothetical protein
MGALPRPDKRAAGWLEQQPGRDKERCIAWIALPARFKAGGPAEVECKRLQFWRASVFSTGSECDEVLNLILNRLAQVLALRWARR